MHFPLFLIGSMFGPPFGVILVNFFGALSDSIIGWGVSNTAGTVSDRFRTMLSAQDATGIAGGAPVGVLLLLLMLLGLLLVIVMLVVQLVTLYFTGVLLPLGLVWTVDPARRKFGTRIVSIWIGVLAAHPLLFLLLSVAYLMVGSNIDAFGSGASLQKTVTLVVVAAGAVHRGPVAGGVAAPRAGHGRRRRRPRERPRCRCPRSGRGTCARPTTDTAPRPPSRHPAGRRSRDAGGPADAEAASAPVRVVG